MFHEGIIIPIAGIMLPLILVPTIMTLKQRARKREYEHRERMKALETGQSLPQHGAWPVALVCTAIGAGVPMMAFVFAWLATSESGSQEEIWIPSMVVGFAGVFAGYKLAMKLLVHGPDQTTPADAHLSKSFSHDPDAYDVVGRRG